MTIGLVVGIVFITLKATGAIAWPWPWVVSPIWIEIAMWCVAGFLISLMGVGGYLWRK